DENVGLVGGGGPKFERCFLFEGAKQNGVRRIRKALGPESFAKKRVFFCRCGSYGGDLPLEVAEGFRLLGKTRRCRKEKEKEGEHGFHGACILGADDSMAKLGTMAKATEPG